MNKIIGITLGEPAGIGSELTAKLFNNFNAYYKTNVIVVGDYCVLKSGLKVAGLNLNIKRIKEQDIQKYRSSKMKKGWIYLLDLKILKHSKIEYAVIKKEYGYASGKYIEKAIQLCMDNTIDAIVTNAINKESFYLGGFGKKYPGHTEMCADLTGTKKYNMLLAHGDLKVIHVTTHISMADARKLIKKKRIYETIQMANNVCINMGIKSPKIAVAGYNPHSGENGLFGNEEQNEITPAIKEAIKNNIDVDGPVPPDTVFAKAYNGFYDIVVAMYHDQGHIPIKTLGFIWNKTNKKVKSIKGVNITLGLPIIRTSVDHGTAFGKAGKGTADEGSLKNALDYAVLLVKYKQK